MSQPPHLPQAQAGSWAPAPAPRIATAPTNLTVPTPPVLTQTPATPIEPQTQLAKPQPARFRRLAAKPLKPLKLAASAISSVRHGASTPTPGTPSAYEDTDTDSMFESRLPPQRSGTASSFGSGTDAQLDASGDAPKMRKRLSFTRKKQESAASLDPVQVALAARGPRRPLEGEEPAAVLRVRIVRADDLVAKDRNGFSDP